MDWIKIIGIVGALVGLLCTVYWLGNRYRWHPEWQRKILHVGLGLTAVTFPWLFDATWQVLTVCLMGILILVAVRKVPCLRRTVGRTLHDVQRTSAGELLFAVAIILLFALAHTTPVCYVLPLVILTLADTAAALVGRQWGRHRFAVLDGEKSWEGVIAFGVVSGGVASATLHMLTPLTWPALLLIALTVAVVGPLIEAIAWHGLDNLLVPLGLHLLVTTLLEYNVALLLYQLIGFGGLALLIYLLPIRLEPHTMLSANVALYCLWIGGVLLWLLALLVALLCLALVEQHEKGRVPQLFDIVPTDHWLALAGR